MLFKLNKDTINESKVIFSVQQPKKEDEITNYGLSIFPEVSIFFYMLITWLKTTQNVMFVFIAVFHAFMCQMAALFSKYIFLSFFFFDFLFVIFPIVNKDL